MPASFPPIASTAPLRPRAPRLALRRPSDRALAVLALLGANAMWGTSVVTSRAVLDQIPPLTLAVLRAAIALGVLLPFVLRAGQRPALGALPALMGLTGLALFYPAFYVGIGYASAANASLVVDGGIPVMTALLAVLVLRERATPARVLGVAISLAGVGAIALRGAAGLDGSVRGNLLLVGCALLIGVYTVVGRRAFAGHGLLAVTTGSLVYGTLLLIPAAAVELATVGAGRPSLTDVGLLLYLGAGVAALAYVLLGFALRRLEAGLVGVFSNVAPLVGVVAAVVVLHEPIGPLQIVGGALIGGGVWLAARAGG